jgi:hypothetical protein
MDKTAFVAELAKLRTSSTFLSLMGYRNEHSEVADHNIIFHISYESALKRSIIALQPIVPASDLETTAKEELLASFKQSLANLKETPMEELEDAYDHFKDEDGSYIKGVKLHRESDTLHLYGLEVQKRIIMPGIYKKVNKRPLTIAKDKLKKLCPVSKFRQFIITPNRVEKISVQNISFLPPDC